MTKKLHRSSTDKVIAGVCGGLAKYLEIDSTLLRVLFVLICLMGGGGILLYIVLMIVMPLEGSSSSAVDQLRDEINKDSHGWHLFFGLILIFIGVIALTKAAFPGFVIFPPIHIFWPVILILGGLYFVMRHHK